MLDSKLLRKETKEVISNLKRRGFEFDETLWTKLESKRKDLQGSTENQQAKLNELSKNIGIAKQNSEDTKDLEKMASELTATLKEQSNELDNLLEQIENFVLPFLFFLKARLTWLADFQLSLVNLFFSIQVWSRESHRIRNLSF